MSDLQRMQLELAGKKAKARARAGRRLSSPPAEVVIIRDPLDSVLFASPRAKELAEEHELTWRAFAKSARIASSDLGYTADDVRFIIAEND